MEIKYKASKWCNEIKPVECERSTEKSVWEIERWQGKETIRRHPRTSDFDGYFDTWEEAKAYLVDRQKKMVAGLKQRTAEANSILGQLRKIKKPEGE